MKCSPMQLHFPHGPDVSPSFPEAKMVENIFFGSETYPNGSKILRISKIDQNFIQIDPILKNLW